MVIRAAKYLEDSKIDVISVGGCVKQRRKRRMQVLSAAMHRSDEMFVCEPVCVITSRVEAVCADNALDGRNICTLSVRKRMTGGLHVRLQHRTCRMEDACIRWTLRMEVMHTDDAHIICRHPCTSSGRRLEEHTLAHCMFTCGAKRMHASSARAYMAICARVQTHLFPFST